MTVSETSAIPHGSWVLVTGANSLVGSNVADRLLSRGYRVRGTVRNAQRHQWLGDHFRHKYGTDSFELVQIQDIQCPGAFDEAMRGPYTPYHPLRISHWPKCSTVQFTGMSGVAHVVTIFAGPNDGPEEVFNSVKQLDHNILASAAAEPSVKRFVYTSSCQAANTMSLDDLNGKTVITSQTWNETAIQRAKAGSPEEWRRGFDIYSASKALGEQGVWEWVKEHKPGFVANTGKHISPCTEYPSNTLNHIIQFYPRCATVPLSIHKIKAFRPHYYGQQLSSRMNGPQFLST